MKYAANVSSSRRKSRKVDGSPILEAVVSFQPPSPSQLWTYQTFPSTGSEAALDLAAWGTVEATHNSSSSSSFAALQSKHQEQHHVLEI